MSGVGCQNDLDITHRLKISRKSVARRGVDPAADIIAFPANACSDFIKFLKYNALPLSVVQGFDGVTLKRPGDFVGAHADVFSSFLRKPLESGRRASKGDTSARGRPRPLVGPPDPFPFVVPASDGEFGACRRWPARFPRFSGQRRPWDGTDPPGCKPSGF